MEQISVFNQQGELLSPAQESIDVVHQKGLWHQTFACWLISPSQKKIFLQLRGVQNRVDPHSFDATAGGHLSVEEKPVDGFRELTEELGISISLQNQFYLGQFSNKLVRGNYLNNEWCHVYLSLSELSLKDFILQQGEVAGLFMLDIDIGIRLFSGQCQTAWIEGVLNTGSGYIHAHRQIDVSDFCAYQERKKEFPYYLRVFQQARQLIKTGNVSVFEKKEYKK